MGMRGRGIGSSMDRQISFERATLVDGPFGQVAEWAPHGQPIAALRQDVSDSEKWQAGVVQATVTTRFMVRSTPFTRDITPADRIEHEGSLFNITGVKEPAIGQRRQLLEFTVEGPINE